MVVVRSRQQQMVTKKCCKHIYIVQYGPKVRPNSTKMARPGVIFSAGRSFKLDF